MRHKVPWFDTDALRGRVKGKMAGYKWTMRRTAEEIGIDVSTMSRFFMGREPDAQTLLKICVWLGESMEAFSRRYPE